MKRPSAGASADHKGGFIAEYWPVTVYATGRGGPAAPEAMITFQGFTWAHVEPIRVELLRGGKSIAAVRFPSTEASAPFGDYWSDVGPRVVKDSDMLAAVTPGSYVLRATGELRFTSSTAPAVALERTLEIIDAPSTSGHQPALAVPRLPSSAVVEHIRRGYGDATFHVDLAGDYRYGVAKIGLVWTAGGQVIGVHAVEVVMGPAAPGRTLWTPLHVGGWPKQGASLFEHPGDWAVHVAMNGEPVVACRFAVAESLVFGATDYRTHANESRFAARVPCAAEPASSAGMQRAVALAASKPFDEFRQMELLALRDSEEVRQTLTELRQVERATNTAVTIQADAGEKKRDARTEGAYRDAAAHERSAERATTDVMTEAVRIRQRYERLVRQHGRGAYPPAP